jgi:hypothetical protein
LDRSSTWKWLHRACAVGALALTGCGALPVITPDLARTDLASVQFGRQRVHRRRRGG